MLAQARARTDTATRQALYRQASAIYLADRPHLFLYHAKLFWAMTDRVGGFQTHPDGLIRLQGGERLPSCPTPPSLPLGKDAPRGR